MLDWDSLERSARLVSGTGQRIDGASLLALRRKLLELVDEASAEVAREAELTASPAAELLVVDRHGWLSGNIRTLERLFSDAAAEGGAVGSAEAKLVAWEGGGFLGLIARMVLGQYDPFRDQLLVVYPNLREFSDDEGMRWLLFHEVTHVAQFRAAPWIADEIVAAGRNVLSLDRVAWAKQIRGELIDRLPDLIRWAKDALNGEASTTPLLDFLPEEQRAALQRVNALVTLLEGHATHVTELIAKRVLPGHERINERIEQRRKRPPLMRLLEALGGIEMKRQQYVAGKAFCEAVWASGGARALAPAWRGPEWAPTFDEIRDPDRWLARVSPEGLQTPA